MNTSRTVFVLSDSEAKRVEQILAVSGKPKVLLLYYTIREHPQLSDAELARKIYGIENINALRQLKHRLNKEITRITAATNVIEVDRAASFNARHNINRSIVNAEALLATGREKDGVKLLKKALKESEKYSLWHQVVSCTDMLLRLYAPIRGIEEFSNLADKRRRALSLSEIEFQAQEIYYYTMLPIFFGQTNAEKDLDTVVQAIHDLDVLATANELNLVKYYNLRIKVYYYNYIKDYETAQHYAHEFLNLVENDMLLNTKSNLSGALMQLSNIELYLSNYGDSMQLARRASNYFSNNAKNYLRSKEVEFLSLFCMRNYDECLRLYDQEVKPRIIDGTIENRTMWLLRMLGCLEMNGSSERAVKLFSSQIESLRNMPSLDIGSRLLEILSFISLKEWDLVEYRYRGFSRLCASKGNSINPRIRIITKHLGYIVRERDKASASSDVASIELLHTLSNGNGAYSWDPFGIEVVPYHKWYSQENED